MFGFLTLLYIVGGIAWLAEHALPFIAIAAPLYLLVRFIRRSDAARLRRQQELDAIRARADQQHRWVWVGDPRGIYGQYPPVAF